MSEENEENIEVGCSVDDFVASANNKNWAKYVSRNAGIEFLMYLLKNELEIVNEIQNTPHGKTNSFYVQKRVIKTKKPAKENKTEYIG